MKGFIPMLDNGHGGRIGGHYTTPPEKGRMSPNWEKGIYYEGVGNRWMVNRIVEILERAGVPYFVVVPEYEDIALSERVRRANKFYHKVQEKAYFQSFHSNGGGGTGYEIFTSPGQTKSDPIAEYFYKRVQAEFRNKIQMRPGLIDGDNDKEAKFAVLTRTDCPAVLHEFLFMDRKEDYLKLQDPAWLEVYCYCIASGMIDLYKNGLPENL